MGKIKKKSKKSNTGKISDDFEESLNEDLKEVLITVDVEKLVPTGSTTFNLECSGRIEGAFMLGSVVNLIGDSHAGKTLFALTIFAECSLLERFDDYRFIYDDVEAANSFDVEHLFGEEVDERMEEDHRSRTIEDFNDNLAVAIEDDRPFIYVLDSFDALTSEAAISKDIANRKARAKGNEIKGSYGDGKAKIASSMFSQRTQEISDDESLVIIISQTRDNIGFAAQFTPKVRSGGKALKFYSAHEVWLAMQKKEKKGKRTFLTNVQAKLTKNKLTGRHGEAFFPILFDYGVDNLMSCIHFLMDEGDWTGSKKSVNTHGFLKVLKRKKKKSEKDKMIHPSMIQLIDDIEENNREDELFEICQENYDTIMESLKPKRKRKYRKTNT